MKTDADTKPMPLEAAFAAAGEQGLREYLEDLFREEPQHITRFVARFCQPGADYLSKAVEAELDEALFSHAEEDGFVTWRESIDFEREYLGAISAPPCAGAQEPGSTARRKVPNSTSTLLMTRA